MLPAMRERRGYDRKEKPAACPFCDQRIPRPAPFVDVEVDCGGGRCACGALFVVDVTGKQGGQVFLDGLTVLCDGDLDRGVSLQAKVDYEVVSLGYRPRTHSLESRLPGRGGFGTPKLWFFRLLAGTAEPP
jgi:hypothetical protein